MSHSRTITFPHKYYILFVLLLSGMVSHAATIKGTVRDSKGEPLPFATIYVEGTTIGVNANGQGAYELSVQPGTYKLLCQYIGYKQTSFNIAVKGSELITHDFTLSDESLKINEVVIHASEEDPAYPIIRNAIRRRKFHLNQLKSFQTSMYFKGVMRSRQIPDKFMGKDVNGGDMGLDSSGKGVLYLTEEEADYYTQGGKEKTVIHSVHESGNQSGLGFSQFPSVITFYKNNVPIFANTSRGFISPVSDNALTYYRYKLLGEMTEHGRSIYKIAVTQKRAYEPCFNGTIYISDSDWAIHSLDLTLAKKSGMDLVDTMKVTQLFLPLKKDTWVIKSQVLYFTVKLMAFDITGTGVAVYNRQRVNEPIPDSVFAGKIVSVYDKAANKIDTSHWENRPIPLEEDEQRDFVVKDSINKVVNSPAYRDSVRRRGNKLKIQEVLIGTPTFSGKEYRNVYSFSSLLLTDGLDNTVNYNTVEGVNFAPKVHWRHRIDSATNMYTDLAPRYGLKNTHFNAIGRVYFNHHDKTWLNRQLLWGVEGGKYVFQYNPDNPVVPVFNTWRTLFDRENDLKIYERWEAAAFARRNFGNGLQISAKFSWQERLPLQNTTDYTFTPEGKGGFTSNTPPELLGVATNWEKHDAVIVTASISYKPGYTYTQYPDYKVAHGSSWPRFTLAYRKGVPGLLNSKTDYDYWRFSIKDDVRLKLFGTLQYHLATGGFLNTRYVSFPDLMHIDGRRGVGYAAPYLESFQFAQYYQWSNTASLYGEAHVEYHLNGLLSNKIPLLRQARYYLVFGGNEFYSGSNTYYTEAFVGIDNIGWKLIRFLRVDFVQSWDSNMGRNSGVRVGINFKGISVSRNSLVDSEW